MKKENIVHLFGNNNPIPIVNGYRTLSRNAVNCFFTSIPRQKIGDYLVKFYQKGAGVVLMDDCSPRIYAEVEEKLDQLSQTVEADQHDTVTIRTEDGIYMYTACADGIIVGYCRSRHFDEKKILTYCLFSVTALNGKRDYALGRLYKNIQHQRHFDFQEAKSALLADAFVASSYPA